MNLLLVKFLEGDIVFCDDKYSDVGNVFIYKGSFCWVVMKEVMFCVGIGIGFCVLMLIDLWILKIFGMFE